MSRKRFHSPPAPPTAEIGDARVNLTFGSIIFMLECQARYIAALLTRAAPREADTVEVRREIADRFDEWLRGRLADSVWSRVRSPYRDASGSVTALWPATMTRYLALTRRPRTGDYLWNTLPSRSRRSAAEGMRTV
ncbi:hypothetical protein AB0J47_30945 [Nocardia sp. NPDC049737]|uniref:hypothetical protein n=1 Tax=Nocardia sp. NPDC049737 TaxID=3154358 RepID=UPI00342161F7